MNINTCNHTDIQNKNHIYKNFHKKIYSAFFLKMYMKYKKLTY